MKKIVILLMVAVGCMPVSNEIKPRVADEGIMMYGNPVLFEFNSHEYIYFKTGHGAIVHNPDCHCLKKDEV